MSSARAETAHNASSAAESSRTIRNLRPILASPRRFGGAERRLLLLMRKLPNQEATDAQVPDSPCICPRSGIAWRVWKQATRARRGGAAFPAVYGGNFAAGCAVGAVRASGLGRRRDPPGLRAHREHDPGACLLYTSDAADERS